MSLDAQIQAGFTAVGNVVKTKISSSEKGAANGVATLDGAGKLTSSQLPASVIGGLIYQGVWDASTNTPTIPAAAAGNKGYYYKVSVAGTTLVDTINDWKVGDWITSNGATWDKIDNTDAVSSVAGRTGAIVLGTADITGLDTALSSKEATITTLPVSKGGTGANTLTGIVKGNGTGAMTAATAGTDYVIPSGNVATATKLATARNINGTAFDGSADITLPVATTSVAGTMSAADKTKLDGIATGATNYVHPTTDGSLHVPATSTTNNGKFLKAGATAGSIAWASLATSDITGLDTALSNKADSSTVTTLSTNIGATNTDYVAVFNAALV